MTNLICQGKIIRQSTRKKVKSMRKLCLQYVTWGGGFRHNLSNIITFFHSVKRIE